MRTQLLDLLNLTVTMSANSRPSTSASSGASTTEGDKESGASETADSGPSTCSSSTATSVLDHLRAPVRPTWQESVKLKPIPPLGNGGVTLEEAGVHSRLSLRRNE